MNLKKHRFLALTLAAVTLISVSGCGTSKEKEAETENKSTAFSDSESYSPYEDMSPADNSDSDLFTKMKTEDLDGATVDSNVFAENTLTLVNVWNVGCTPCIQEIPSLDQLNKEYADKKVAIKGLYYDFEAGISDEARKEVQEILSSAKADYQQLLISKDMLNSDALQQLAAFPTTYLVDSNGKILDTLEGSRPYEGWKEVIENTLAKVNANE